MAKNELNEEINIFDRIYNSRQEDFEKSANYDREILANKLNNITLDEMEEIIKKQIEEENEKQIVLKKLNQLIENYKIKIGYYSEKNYKQGFKDAIKLCLECSK